MPQAVHLQSNFTLGEIDERLHARVDLDILSKGAKRARNVVTLPQGGLRRRFGTKYIAPASVMTTPTTGRIAMFEYSDETQYLLLFEHLHLHIYHNDVEVADVAIPHTGTQIANIKFTQSSDEFIVVHPDVVPYVLARTVAHTGWNFSAMQFTWFPTYDFDKNYDSSTFTPSAISGDTVTITATDGTPFKEEHVGGLFFGNEGTLRIETFTDTTHVIGFTVDAFKNTDAISGKLSVITEPVWSTTLGWPRCTTYFQGRLCFGGGGSIPQGIWMSKTNSFTNFDDSEALATSSISIFIHTNNSNIVEEIIGEKAFLIFTSTGLVSTQMMTDAPLTITNVAFNLQNNDGIGKAPPKIFDNKIIYIDKGGKILWAVQYDFQQGGHASTDISIMSQQLLNYPTDLATYRNPDIDNGNYLILVNSDGTLAILQAVDSQDVLGWTHCMTDNSVGLTETPEKGMFRHIAASGNIVYFIVERLINNLTVFLIEKIDFGLELDSTSVQDLGGPTTAVSGLSHLEGRTVKVLGDGILQADKVVSGSAITMDTAATNVEIGLNYETLIVPLPVSLATLTGSDLYLSRRIKTLWVDYYESLGIYVDGQLIPYLTLDESRFDVPLPLKTDFFTATPMQGWDPRAEIEIKQIDPYPMILRGLGMEIDTANVVSSKQ